MKTFKKIIAVFLCVVMAAACVPITAYAKKTDEPAKTEANIVLFGYFNNYTQDEADLYFEQNLSSIMKIIDGSNGRSFKNYIKTISYGKLEIENIFPQYDGTSVKPVKIDVSEDAAKQRNYDVSVIDALVKGMPAIADKTVDRDGDGYVDNVMLVVMSSSSDATSGSTLVAHKGDYTGSSKINGKSIGMFNMFGSYRLLNEKYGLVCHEFLHTLGYADLYKSSGTQSPVYNWSIMGGPSAYPQYPLAYERMYFTNWLSIDEVTESQSLTLDTQSNPDGNQAYIIKSPFSDREIFVVEYRERPNRYVAGDEDSLDYSIGGSGVIVYRVNLNVDGLSNLGSENGIYVFRPQDGQPGYSQTETAALYNAYLPYDSYDGKRSSVGSSDMSATLSDGALTYDNGSNSGIVISNVKLSADKKQATLDVTVPQKEDYDLWESVNFKNEASGYDKNIVLQSCNNNIYSVAYENNKIYSKKYDGTSWSVYAPEISAKYASNVSMAENNGVLYLAFFAYENNKDCLNVYKFDIAKDTSWTLLKSDTSIMNSGVSLGVANGKTYIAYSGAGDWTGYPLMVGEVTDNGVTAEQTGISESFTLPRVTEYNGEVIVAYKNSSNTVCVGKYANGGFVQMHSVTIGYGNYALANINSKLYLALTGDDTKVLEYDGAWNESSISSLSSNEVGFTSVGNNVYLLASSQSGGKYGVYYYENGTFTQSGENVDTYSINVNAASIANTIYTGYVHQGENYQYDIFVKRKAVKSSSSDLPAETVDKSALEYALAIAEQHLSEDYSDETIAALKGIYQKNKALLEDNATQKQIDDATAEILESIANLKPYFYGKAGGGYGKCTVKLNGVEQTTNSFVALYGDVITLSATENAGCSFVGWYDNVSNRYVSTSKEYSFKACSNFNISAVCTVDLSATLTFANNSGWIAAKKTLTVSQWKNITDISSLLPSVPYSYGYSNGRWVYDNDDVLARLRNGENVTLVPTYDSDNTSMPELPSFKDDPVLELYYRLDSDKNVGSFVMAVGADSNIKIESVGFAVYYAKAEQFDPADFDLRLNNKTTASSFNTEKLEDYYILNINKLSTTYNWAVRGYISYVADDGSLKTVYSNQINLVNRLQVY